MVEAVFDKNPGCRPEAEWRRMLGALVESLSVHTGLLFAPTSWFINDHPGHSSAGGCVDIRAVLNPMLRLDVCGVVCISVNHGESAWVSATLLLFSEGQRLLGPNNTEVIEYQYTPNGWGDRGWMCGECGEWERDTYPTDRRWQSEPIIVAQADSD